MWTNENRGRYDRSRLRYPSDLTDDEWNLVEPLIPPGKRGGDKGGLAPTSLPRLQGCRFGRVTIKKRRYFISMTIT
jgi:hypothetical protein